MTVEATQNQESVPVDEMRELCPDCLTANVEGSNFCRKCGGPLSAYAAIGPWEHLFAEGHIYRKATERPQKLIVVLGIWMIFGPVAAIAISVLAMEWANQHLWQRLLLVALASISAILIFKSTLNFIRQRRLMKDQRTSSNATRESVEPGSPDC